MGLFDKFDSIYNTDVSSAQVRNMKTGRLPYEVYDKEGNLSGYYWYYGDTIELHFIIDGEVTADSATANGVSVETVYTTAEEYLSDKNAKICIYSSLRYEPVLETVLSASTDIKLIIDEETSKKLLRGTYYITLTIFKDNESILVPIIENKQCTITIK